MLRAGTYVTGIDASSSAVLRHRDVCGERRAAHLRKIDRQFEMLSNAEPGGDGSRRVELDHVPLAVAHAQRVQVEALSFQNGGGRVGIQTARQEDDNVHRLKPVQGATRSMCCVHGCNGRRTRASQGHLAPRHSHIPWTLDLGRRTLILLVFPDSRCTCAPAAARALAAGRPAPTRSTSSDRARRAPGENSTAATLSCSGCRRRTSHA